MEYNIKFIQITSRQYNHIQRKLTSRQYNHINHITLLHSSINNPFRSARTTGILVAKQRVALVVVLCVLEDISRYQFNFTIVLLQD